MVRELSARGYGDFAYVLAITGVCVVIADMGFSRVMVRDLAREDDARSLVGEMLRARSLGVLGVTAAFTVLAVAGGLPDAPTLGLAAAAFLLSEAFAFGYESAAVGIERPARFAVVQLVAGAAVGVAAVIASTAHGLTPAGAMAGLAAASAIKLAAHRALWRGGRPRPFRELPVRRWARESAPFLALALLAAAYYRAGIVVLHATRGPQDAAPFAAAMRVFDGVALVGSVGYSAVSPAVSRIHRDSPDRLWGAWKRMVGRAALLVLPFALAGIVWSEEVARVLFGSRYATPSGQLLRILIPGMTLAVLQSLSAAVVFMSDDGGDVLRLTAVNVTVLLVMVTWFTSLRGAEGTATAITIAEVISFVTFALLIHRRHGVVLTARAG